MENIKRHARVDVADVLRGFAVLSIILLHSIEHFNFYQFPDVATRAEWLRFADTAIWDGLFFMFGGKAYAIFAMLFGFSFFIQDDNQRMRGRDFRLRFCCRLLLLLAIGQVNAAFFTGEVLVLYGLVGFLLPLVCRLGTRTLVVLGAVLMLQPVCIWQAARAAFDPSYVLPATGWEAAWEVTFAAQDGGTFWSTVMVNLREGQLFSLGWAWDHGRVFQTAALFVFGMLIGRHGWFGQRWLDRWGVVLACALVAFFPLRGLNAMLGDYISNPNLLRPLGIIVSSLANVAFMLILVSGIMFAYYRTTRLSRFLSLLIPYGRMSMTNYVTQGIIGSALFYNWGLHLRMGITGSLLTGVAIFLVQYGLCRLWVLHHSHGPLEYLWKRATWLEFPFACHGNK